MALPTAPIAWRRLLPLWLPGSFWALFCWKQALWYTQGPVALALALGMGGLTYLLWRLFAWGLGQWGPAQAWALWVSFLLLFYTPLYLYLGAQPLTAALGRHRILLPGLALLLGLLWYGHRRYPQRGASLTRLSYGILIVWSLGELAQIAYRYGHYAPAHAQVRALAAAATRPPVPPAAARPSILHLVLDAHTSPQALRTYWGYEDTILTQALRRQGFTLYPAARSPYPHTAQSLPALFRGDTLPKGGTYYGDPWLDYAAARVLIRDQPVWAALQAGGYRLRNLSGFQIGDAPPHYTIPFFPDPTHTASWMLAKTLPGALWADFGRRQAHLASLDILDSLRQQPPPTGWYTYAHLMLPHAPYYYQADGQRLSVAGPHDDPAAYLAQLIFTDRQVVACLAAMHPQPPVVIVQGDHGFRYLADSTQRQIEAQAALWAWRGLPPVERGPQPATLHTYTWLWEALFGE